MIGPRSIGVVTTSADGVVLCEGSGPRYVGDVRRRIGPDRAITVFLYASADADGVRRAVDEHLGRRDDDQRLAPYAGVATDDLRAELALGNDPESWPEALDAWYSAGADSIVLTPLPTDPASVVDGWVVG